MGVSALLVAYLILYYILLAGAIVTIWRSGLIEHLDRSWTVAAIVAAVLLGVLLAGTSRRRPPPAE